MTAQKSFNIAAKNLGKQLLQSIGRFNTELFAVGLVEQNADLTQKDKDGNTALMIAVTTRKSLAAQAMLARDIDVSTVDRKGFNALALAVIDGNAKMADMLVKHGAQLTSVQIVDIATSANLSKACTDLLRDIAARQDKARHTTPAAKPSR